MTIWKSETLIRGQKILANFALTGGEDFEPDISDEAKKTKQKNLYENFVKERDREERGRANEDKNAPKQG